MVVVLLGLVAYATEMRLLHAPIVITALGLVFRPITRIPMTYRSRGGLEFNAKPPLRKVTGVSVGALLTNSASQPWLSTSPSVEACSV